MVVKLSMEANHKEVKMKTLFRLTLSTWFKTLGSQIQVVHCQHILSTTQCGNPWCTMERNYIKTQLKVHVISSKKMSSRDRQPVKDLRKVHPSLDNTASRVFWVGVIHLWSRLWELEETSGYIDNRRVI